MLDARMCMPTVGITTTTRDPSFSLDDLRDAEKRLWRALREGRRIGARGPRRKDEPRYDAFPDLRYCAFLEFTSGEGTRSGGYRRPHLHHLTKGIPTDHPLLAPQLDDDGNPTNALERRVSELWKAITGDAWVVECRPLRTPVGAIRYLALHHRKKSQAPPPGYSGRRLRPSRESRSKLTGEVIRRGYYEQPVAELRKLARELASHERVEWAVGRAISTELRGRDEFEVDDQMRSALALALRDMAERPPELQTGLFTSDKSLRIAEHPGLDYDAEGEDFSARVVSELERIREENPPELVRVHERQVIDYATGAAVREAVAVLGPVHRKVA